MIDTDPEEIYISATDIKNWVYCPLIVYYRKVLKASPKVESQQEAGRDKHRLIEKKIDRRKYIASRIRYPKIKDKRYNVELTSEEENLTGVLDILAEGENGELLPIEVKTTSTNNGKAWRDHILQLTFYSILLQKRFGKKVRRGFIYYVGEEKLIEIQISTDDVKYVEKIIKDIKRMLKEEKPPKARVSRRKCTGGCGYKWICFS